MELKKGYKQTEVGIIPTDWEVKSIGELLKIRHGKDQKGIKSDDGLYPIFGTGGLMGFSKEFLYDKESVLIGRKGTIDKPMFMDTPFWTVDTLFYSQVEMEYNAKFIYYKFLQIDWYAHNEASGVPSLNARTIEKIQISIPPSKAEQSAIATTLSDMDNLIAGMEQLIAKKKAIKQGAMQELLRPKEGWVDVSINELCIPGGIVRGPFGGALKKDSFVESGYKVYEQRNAIYQSVDLGSYFITPSKFKELKRFEVRSGDFIISCSGTIGKIFKIPENFQRGIINQALLKLTIDTSKYSGEYFFHYFSWDKFQSVIIDSTQGGAMKNLIGMPEFKKTAIPMPSSLIEQESIAKVLSIMDEEIVGLESHLGKYKMLKQGMMQELLTGKTRLV